MEILKFITGPVQVNTYLAYDESKLGFLVDPGDYHKAITNTIIDKEIKLEYIILTHGHGDHIGGVLKFKEDFPDAKILAYKDEREMLRSPSLNLTTDLFGKPIAIEADKYVDDKESITIGNTVLTFIHTPGHTPGGMSILMPGILFSGDTLFQASIGRTDFPGGDFSLIMKSIKEKLFLLPDNTRVLPGHMGETTIGFEKENNPFV